MAGHQEGAPPAPGGAAETVAGGIDRAVDAMGRWAAWLTLAIVALMAVDVLLRYAFSIGSVWAQELEWHLLAPVVLVGMTYALQKGDHVRVDIFYAKYSPRTQALVDVISAVLAVIFALLVLRYSLRFVAQSWSINEISSDPGGLTHRWVLKALIPAGFAVFALQAAAQAIRAFLRWKRAAP